MVYPFAIEQVIWEFLGLKELKDRAKDVIVFQCLSEDLVLHAKQGDLVGFVQGLLCLSGIAKFRGLVFTFNFRL
ncbi:hypothetical protein HDU96_005043, partial [Phlyctochytrium bullatum]